MRDSSNVSMGLDDGYNLILPLLWNWFLNQLGLTVYLRTKWLWVWIPLQSLKLKYHACFEQEVSWHSGNYRV